jgi:transposase
MYYIELSEGISPINARSKVSKMFLISTTTVQRWVTAWETTGDKALQDCRKKNL